KFEQRGAHAVELLSANGRVMAAHTGTKPSAYSFPTNQLASGVYFVRVKTDGMEDSQRFIVNR
ncbi:MAG: T9SS type A sorting domain-containing protein, partial [Chitinivibrionales bacterium]|nr:T9SS type A sorting domain-containing protein [Chitinivibrionales bacterium]